MSGLLASFMGMGSVQGPALRKTMLDLILFCHLLRILNNFPKRNMHFYFAQGPANSVAGTV